MHSPRASRLRTIFSCCGQLRAPVVVLAAMLPACGGDEPNQNPDITQSGGASSGGASTGSGGVLGSGGSTSADGGTMGSTDTGGAGPSPSGGSANGGTLGSTDTGGAGPSPSGGAGGTSGTGGSPVGAGGDNAVGGSTGGSPFECTREVLDALADDYFAALGANDPSTLPLAEDAKFTENAEITDIGTTEFWMNAGDLKHSQRLLDTTACSVAAHAVVPEGGVDRPIALRIKVEAGELTEIETIVVRRPCDYVRWLAAGWIGFR